ncbi:MAG: hypothetical protein JW881_07460 [Spirochaetales bacterium]|nr:hypothetical protein [Spirochaetales bacterium]
MTPEDEARRKIDELLNLAGWTVQDYHELNLGVSFGVAIREFPWRPVTQITFCSSTGRPSGQSKQRKRISKSY